MSQLYEVDPQHLHPVSDNLTFLTPHTFEMRPSSQRTHLAHLLCEKEIVPLGCKHDAEQKLVMQLSLEKGVLKESAPSCLFAND